MPQYEYQGMMSHYHLSCSSPHLVLQGIPIVYYMVQSRVTVVVTTRTTGLEPLWPHYDNTSTLFTCTYIANMTKFKNEAGLIWPVFHIHKRECVCCYQQLMLEQEEAYQAPSLTILTIMAPVGKIWRVESSCILLSLVQIPYCLDGIEAGSAHYSKTRFVIYADSGWSK